MIVSSSIAAVALWTVLKSQPCREIDLNLWFASFQEALLKEWHLPEGFGDNQDEVTVRFTLLRDGSIRRMVVEEPGKSKEATEAALTALRRVIAPPLPPEFRGFCIELIAHLQYNFSRAGANRIGHQCECVP